MQPRRLFEDSFQNRHNSASDIDIDFMLRSIEASTIDQLIEQTIPATIRHTKPLDLPPALTEAELLEEMQEIANENQVNRSFIGAGYYDTHTPPVILRNIIENPGWYTQYTPYQAEISQGRLESLLNFQTMVIDLTGLELSNASLLDEATAAAEAMNMIYASRKGDVKTATTFFVDEDVFPQTLDVLQTRAEPLGINIAVGNINDIDFDGSIFGVYVQYPSDTGDVRNYATISERAHESGALVCAGTDLLALTLLTPPGIWGADIAVGSAQRFGVPLGYGGPHAGFISAKESFKRLMPGRIIGVSTDAQGNTAYRMALQTREQHIRRDKATSNICTAQALLANVAAMYAVYHGPKGLAGIGERVHTLTCALAGGLKALGIKVKNETWFDTLTINVTKTDQLKERAEAEGMNLRYRADGLVGIALDETTTFQDLGDLLSVLASHTGTALSETVEQLVSMATSTVPETLRRRSSYLNHQVFNSHHSEHEMLRYLKHLENKDLSLVHSMIPLGSCTMKLNATAEMMPLTWAGFSKMHPFAPLYQAQGYQRLFRDLESWLCEITGFDAISLQPNAGAQGEYAGLLAIRNFHRANGHDHRNIALIPSSAHGTNPASAVMAGMKVVVIKATEDGHIDIDDLRARAIEHKDSLAALMVTYPSTHGVFEEGIRTICSIIHENGGRVYMDGANMNAQVGLTSPREIGADVCHLNLHKTFCIPHGGGGPGMGPIGVTRELAPYLPGHRHGSEQMHREGANSAVSAAPWSSASILTISYAYIRMMGSAGLTKATQMAILNANYLKTRLQKHYTVLFEGNNGRAAHEFIIDLREFKQRGGIEAQDVAKRLMDYGFHAPTMSFPVAGTMMIEPTESESLLELDRFVSAMLSIREELEEVCSGKVDATENVLRNAPHTQFVATSDTWDYPYSREKAVFPVAWVRERKFWPSVGRVDNAQGDRILICTCPSIEEFVES